MAEILDRYGYPATYHNRFVHWRKARMWDQLLEEVSKAFGGDIIMTDSTCVRVQQHGAMGKKGISTMAHVTFPWGFTSKIHALVDAEVRHVVLHLTGGQVHDSLKAENPLKVMDDSAILLADKGCDSKAIRYLATEEKAWVNIPPRSNRKGTFALFPLGLPPAKLGRTILQ